jgi:RHS repeat-associated protein
MVSQYEPTVPSSQFYAFDLTGSTRVATHLPGDVTSTVDYTAFGTQYYLTGGSNLPFRFGGLWGYYKPGVPAWILYVMQRWLDVAFAQWTSRDLIGFDGGDWNLYRYVVNNPVRSVDPSGRGFIGALGCAASCCYLAPLECPNCAELCHGLSSLQELNDKLDKICRDRGNCAKPKQPIDCVNYCIHKGSGASINESNCRGCCDKFPGEPDDASSEAAKCYAACHAYIYGS